MTTNNTVFWIGCVSIIAWVIFLLWLMWEAWHAPEMLPGETEAELWMRQARENEVKRKKEIAKRMMEGKV